MSLLQKQITTQARATPFSNSVPQQEKKREIRNREKCESTETHKTPPVRKTMVHREYSEPTHLDKRERVFVGQAAQTWKANKRAERLTMLISRLRQRQTENKTPESNQKTIRENRERRTAPQAPQGSARRITSNNSEQRKRATSKHSPSRKRSRQMYTRQKAASTEEKTKSKGKEKTATQRQGQEPNQIPKGRYV